MAPPNKPGAQAKLPIAPDLDQILNRVSLAVSRSQRLFSQAHRAQGAPATAAAPMSKTKTPAQGTFSAQSSSSAPAAQSTTPSATASLQPQYSYKSAAQLAAEDADFEAARNLPPNAGLGYATPGAEATRRTREAEFALRRKLGLRKATESGAGKRGRAVVESDSEDEVGRSALGRAKKVKVQPSQPPPQIQTKWGGGANSEALGLVASGLAPRDLSADDDVLGEAQLQQDVEKKPALITRPQRPVGISTDGAKEGGPKSKKKQKKGKAK